MSTLAERLAAALAADPSKSKAGLARACAVSKPAVTGWFQGGGLDGVNLIPAAKYLGVTPEWLVTGRGQMTPSITETRLTPTIWDNESEVDGEKFFWAPMEPEEVNGGPTGSDNHEERYEAPFRRSWLASEGVKPQDFAVMRVSGRSMEPALWDGNVVGIDKGKRRIIDGRIYVVRLDDHPMVKAIRRDIDAKQLVLVSYNADKSMFPDIRIDEDQAAGRLQVVGIVFWQAGKPFGGH